MLQPAAPADYELLDARNPLAEHGAHIVATTESTPGLGLDHAADHGRKRPQ
jgi:hypothetical protein